MLVGQKFGMLTVIERAPNRGHNKMWLCRCDCGNEIIARNDKLLSGKKTSCGCQITRRTVSPGDRFGKLIAVEKVDDKWLCKCDCGRESLVTGGHLLSGNTRSCGCLVKKYYIEPGWKFGSLTVIDKGVPEKDMNRKGQTIYLPTWRCQCVCGNVVDFLPSMLTSGRVKSCGCQRGKSRWKSPDEE